MLNASCFSVRVRLLTRDCYRRILVLFSQEQWDIYKLDPVYDCYLPPSPGIPMMGVLRLCVRKETTKPH